MNIPGALNRDPEKMGNIMGRFSFFSENIDNKTLFILTDISQ